MVQNGDVHVSAPIGLSHRQIDEFIEANQAWIDKARRRTLDRLQKREAFFAKLPLSTRAERNEARQRLNALIPPMVERHAAEMGVKPSVIKYKALISKWGICNVKDKSICFSAYLLLLPEWCVEHVVVHELCHLLEPSHNARFHALMDRYYPRWREANRTTRNIYRMEEE